MNDGIESDEEKASATDQIDEFGVSRSTVFWVLLISTALPYIVFSSFSIYNSLVVLHRILGDPPQISSEILNYSREAVEDNQPTANYILEEYAMDIRHERASLAMGAQIWIRTLSVLVGSTLVFIGSVFVLGRVASPKSRIRGESASIKIAITIYSPGILIAILGCFLISVPVFRDRQISIQDAALYVSNPGTLRHEPVKVPSRDEICKALGDLDPTCLEGSDAN